jgi:hypothetical protein
LNPTAKLSDKKPHSQTKSRHFDGGSWHSLQATIERGSYSMHSSTKALAGVFTAALVLGISASASANHDHSKRAEVNKGLEKENKHIDRKYKEGDMTKAEKHELLHEDHEIRKEERDMASQDDGHITKQEHKLLDEQEKDVKRQISQ